MRRSVAFRYSVLTPLAAAALSLALAACGGSNGPKVLGLVSITANGPCVPRTKDQGCGRVIALEAPGASQGDKA